MVEKQAELDGTNQGWPCSGGRPQPLDGGRGVPSGSASAFPTKKFDGGIQALIGIPPAGSKKGMTPSMSWNPKGEPVSTSIADGSDVSAFGPRTRARLSPEQ
jgi:hypothetical protein